MFHLCHQIRACLLLRPSLLLTGIDYHFLMGIDLCCITTKALGKPSRSDYLKETFLYFSFNILLDQLFTENLSGRLQER